MKNFWLWASLLGMSAELQTVHVGAAPKNSSRQPSQKKRLSILDYYYLLPNVGNIDRNTNQRRQLLEEGKRDSRPDWRPIIDLRNDFMRLRTDSFPATQIAVFRGSGGDVVAQSNPDFHSDYNSFTLYRLRNGQLRDVTREVLPFPAQTNRLLYELPRLGTNIRVYRFDLKAQTRRYAFDLRWRAGRLMR